MDFNKEKGGNAVKVKEERLIFDSRPLRGYIKEWYGTQQAFARVIGISDTALYGRLKGQVPFSQIEMARAMVYAPQANMTADKMMRLFFTFKIRKNARKEIGGT